MKSAEKRRIEALIQIVTEALDEPAPPELSIEQVALLRRLNRLSRRGQRALVAMVRTEETVRMLKAHEAQDNAAEEYNREVEAAKRWALEMGRTARMRNAR